MLIGEYKVKLTEKNRIALPKKFRQQLNTNLIITRGYEGCLIIVDKSKWKHLIKMIEKRPLTNQDVRNTKRFLVGGASIIELDKQGRFVLPEMLKEYAKIKTNIVFVGLEDWIEIWDEDLWNAKILQISKTASDIADRLSKIK